MGRVHAPGPPVVEVAVLWGDSLVALEHVQDRERLTIGDSGYCDLVAPVEGEFPLLRRTQSEAFLQFGIGFRGVVEEAGKTAKLEELVASGRAPQVKDGTRPVFRFRLDRGARARLQFGGMTFLIQRVAPTQRVGLAMSSMVDVAFLSLFVLAVVIAVGGSLALDPRTPRPPPIDALLAPK
jgi:hypothetical protein